MNLRTAVLTGGLLLVASQAPAQTATVTFTGQLLATTCAVTVRANGGSSGADGRVVLSPIPASRLDAAGARAGRRTWQILVGSANTPCRASRVQTAFRNVGMVNPQGRLRNTGTAGNVDVAVSNAEVGSGNPDIDLTTNAHSQVRDIPPTSGWVALSYASEYYATAPARGGTVITAVQYDLVYP